MIKPSTIRTATRELGTIAMMALVIPLMLATAGLAAEKKAPRTLTINTEHYPPLSTTEGTGFEDVLAKEMYRRIGIEIKFNFLPSERALINVD